MGLHKGTTNNPHGRPKGAKNKNNERKKLIWDLVLYECKDNIVKNINDLFKTDPEKAMEIVLSISKIIQTKEKKEDELTSIFIDDIIKQIHKI